MVVPIQLSISNMITPKINFLTPCHSTNERRNCFFMYNYLSFFFIKFCTHGHPHSIKYFQ